MCCSGENLEFFPQPFEFFSEWFYIFSPPTTISIDHRLQGGFTVGNFHTQRLSKGAFTFLLTFDLTKLLNLGCIFGDWYVGEGGGGVFFLQ